MPAPTLAEATADIASFEQSATRVLLERIVERAAPRQARPVPTLADAQRAADLIAERHGAGRILLFGSLARDEARAGSDIDLVVVFDDLDRTAGGYDMLWRALRATAREAAGCPVDVKVTDRPEWRHRSEKVTNSIEHHISTYALALRDDPPQGEVKWEKKIMLPADNMAETNDHIVGMRDDLDGIMSRYLPNEIEGSAPAGSDTARVYQIGRLKAVCASGAMALEHGLKALVSMEDRWPKRSHSGNELVEQLPEDLRGTADALPSDLLDRMAAWREAGTYPKEFRLMGLSAEELCDEAERYTAAAIAFAVAVAARHEEVYGIPSTHTRLLSELAQWLQVRSARIRLWDGSERPAKKGSAPPKSLL